jgi:hypothetical protein
MKNLTLSALLLSSLFTGSIMFRPEWHDGQSG